MLKHIPFYASLLDEMVGEEKATASHVLVYGAVEAHSLGEKGCIASNATIASETGLKTSTVSKVMSQLNAAGWVVVNLDEKRNRMNIVPQMQVLLPSKGGLTVQKGGSYSTVNIEYSNKKTVLENDTNVSLAKPLNEYGNVEINQVFLYWKETIGFDISSKIQLNRKAANNLLRKHKIEGVQKLIDGVLLAQQDRYAPRIADFCDLQAKLNQLLAWGRTKSTNNKERVAKI